MIDDELTECCGQPLRFDPNLRGTTVGGLARVGWLVCDGCGAAYVTRQGQDADAVDWTLAKGGRSINAGGMRIRVDGAGDVKALMARLMRLPALEAEVEELRSEVTRLGARP